jgi:DNA anti-recombination protein RmuC
LADDETVDLRFSGKQVQNLQVEVRDLRTDVRDLRSKQLRLEGDVASLRTSMEVGFESVNDRIECLGARSEQLEAETRAGFWAVEARLDQMNQTMATNLQIVLAAIGK